MSDKEKFEGFKKNMIEENEKKYGNDTVETSNAKLMNMTEGQLVHLYLLNQLKPI